MVDAYFQLDDLVLAPDRLEASQVFQKAVIKREYEVIIPKDEKEILIRDLKPGPYAKMAEQLVNFYIDNDPSIDYLEQNILLNKYLKENKFDLKWLVPIVKDEKIVYKKRLEGPTTLPQDNNDLNKALNNVINNANVGQSQVIVESLHNYRSVITRTNAVNHSGAHVLRLNVPPDQLGEEVRGNAVIENLELRGSYGDWKLVQVQEKAKTIRKSVVIGFQYVERVVGERLQVVGFALLPHKYPSPSIINKGLSNLMDVTIDKRTLRGDSSGMSPSEGKRGLERILREYLPDVGRILDPAQTPMIDLNGLTDFDHLLKLLQHYGHKVQSLTQANRKTISALIKDNIDLITPQYYQRTDRLEYPELERELIKVGIDSSGGILGPEILNHPVMIRYGIDFSQFPHIFHKYLRIIARLDNGETWLALINPNNTAEQIEHTAHHYQIIKQNREIALDLEISYDNMRRKTIDNPALYEHLQDPNPLSNILELKPDKRDKIAWYQYFKRGYPDRTGKNILFHRKYLGCQHEYDRLYQDDT